MHGICLHINISKVSRSSNNPTNKTNPTFKHVNFVTEYPTANPLEENTLIKCKSLISLCNICDKIFTHKSIVRIHIESEQFLHFVNAIFVKKY